MKVRVDFLEPPRSTDKTTLIIKVSKGESQLQAPPLTSLVEINEQHGSKENWQSHDTLLYDS